MSAVGTEEKMEQPVSGEILPAADKPAAFVPAADAKGKTKLSSQTILLGAVALLVLLFVVLFALSTKGKGKQGRAQKSRTAAAIEQQQQQQRQQQAGSITPTDQRAPDRPDMDDNVSPGDLERTKDKTGATSRPRPDTPSPSPALGQKDSGVPGVGSGRPSNSTNRQAAGENLGTIKAFQRPNLPGSEQPQQWTPQPYNQSGSAGAVNVPQSAYMSQDEARERKEQVSKPSMIFTRRDKAQLQNAGMQVGKGNDSPTITNFGLRPGYHVAVRLEAAACTAIKAPVTAVVEYNYMHNGRVLIPAGSRAIGTVVGAQGSGIIDIAFETLELPAGYAVPISSVGLDTNLRPIKGVVTGRKRGKAMIISTLSGIGQAAAMLVGTDTSSAYSQNDMMRSRIAQNAGSATDAQIMKMLGTEQLVVTVPAGTKLNLVFTQPATTSKNSAIASR